MPAALLIRGGASESLTPKGASELESGVDDLSMDFLHVVRVVRVMRAGRRGVGKGGGGKKRAKKKKKSGDPANPPIWWDLIGQIT